MTLRSGVESVWLTLRRCVYCGAKTKTELTCTAHRDLPPLDPHLAAWMRDTLGARL